MPNRKTEKDNGKKIICPRCKKDTTIIDYGDTFECVECNQEFDKKDLEMIKDSSQILSIEDKLGIVKTLKPEIDENNDFNENNKNEKKNEKGE